MTAYRGKRLLDLVIVVPTLILSLPVQAVVAVAVRLGMGRPVLFRQQRPGLDGRPFELVKFRTMTPAVPSGPADPSDPPGSADPATDAARITAVGRVLRSTSLDELPTLWNVLRGEMSLVGPRPLLMAYLGRYSPQQARRHLVRPGVTGLAQVGGRNALTWEEKFALDVEYVDTASLSLDLRILAETVGKVVRREGIAAEGSSTMPEFLGSAPPRETP